MKKVIISLATVAALSISAVAAPVDKDGVYLDKANKLIGALSYQDKQEYIAEFKELETLEEKAAWFKKVIVAETSVENAINYALEGQYGEVVESHMIKSGLLTKNDRGNLVVVKNSDAYKELSDKRETKWQKHVGNTNPVPDRKPDTGVNPIDPGFGVDPIDVIVKPIDPRYGISPLPNNGNFKASQANKEIAEKGYAAMVSSDGIVTFENGQTVDLQNADEVEAAKAGIAAAAAAGANVSDDDLSATAYNVTATVWNKDNGKVNYSAYAGLKLVDVSGTVDGVDDSDKYMQGIVGFEVGYDIYSDKFQIIGALEAQLGEDVSGISPIVGFRGYLTDNISIDIKAEYLNIGMNDYENYEPVATLGINYKF